LNRCGRRKWSWRGRWCDNDWCGRLCRGLGSRADGAGCGWGRNGCYRCCKQRSGRLVVGGLFSIARRIPSSLLRFITGLLSLFSGGSLGILGLLSGLICRFRGVIRHLLLALVHGLLQLISCLIGTNCGCCSSSILGLLGILSCFSCSIRNLGISFDLLVGCGLIVRHLLLLGLLDLGSGGLLLFGIRFGFLFSGRLLILLLGFLLGGLLGQIILLLLGLLVVLLLLLLLIFLLFGLLVGFVLDFLSLIFILLVSFTLFGLLGVLIGKLLRGLSLGRSALGITLGRSFSSVFTAASSFLFVLD